MKSSVRIAHVVDSMEVGGAEMIVASLCRLQQKSGLTPSIHCLHRLGPLASEMMAEGIPAVLHGPGTRFQIAGRLQRSFREHAVTVVHCHNAAAMIYGVLPARRVGAEAIVCTRHGMVAPPFSWRREVQFWLAVRAGHYAVAVCETARRNLLAAPLADPKKIVMIYNGAHPVESVAAARDPDNFTLLTVGRLAREKDHATLLRALASARQKRPELRLWIVGDGPLAPALRALVEELGIAAAVTFFGQRRDIPDFLARADAFVLSSVTEGVPIALLEAMSAGLPAIVTSAGGMPEVVEPSGAGLVVPPSDAHALAAAMEKMAAARNDLSRLRQAARDCFLQRFTADRMAAEYLRLYESC